MYLFAINNKKKWRKLVYFLLFLLSSYALIQSGTRASIVMLLSSIAILHVIYSKVKITFFIKILSLATTSFFVILLFTNDGEMISRWRLSSNLDELSAYRISGWIQLWEKNIDSNFLGKGFGLADKIQSSIPTNMFYLGILTEIGFLGLFGLLLIIFFPIIIYIRSNVSEGKSLPFDDDSITTQFSLCSMFGFLIYLIFEFTVFRVSSDNNFFFCCWGMLTATAIQSIEKSKLN